MVTNVNIYAQTIACFYSGATMWIKVCTTPLQLGEFSHMYTVLHCYHSWICYRNCMCIAYSNGKTEIAAVACKLCCL